MRNFRTLLPGVLGAAAATAVGVVDPDGSTPVGLGASPDNPPTMLLRLTAKG